MKFFIYLLLTLPLVSQEERVDTCGDLSGNRLFTMSTGYTQPKGTVSVSVLMFAGYQMLYTPIAGVQLNAGIVLPRHLIYGMKFQAYDGKGFVRALALTTDATYTLRSDKSFKERTRLIPSINATFGFDNLQFSTSFVSYIVEKFKYVPRDPFDWISESDGFVGDRKFFAVPALMQVGLQVHSNDRRIKFITEVNYEYEGKRNAYPLKVVSFGFKKNWDYTYLDVAFIMYYEHRSAVHSETFFFPWIGWGGVIR